MSNVGTTQHVPGYADDFGGKLFNVPTYRGVQSYQNGVGDALHPRQFGFATKLLAVIPLGISVSGTYYAMPRPAGAGATTWYLQWFVVGTNDEVANGVNLSAEILQLMGIGL